MLNIMPAFAASAPSSWAKAEVDEAASLGLVPEDLQDDYQSYCTREEFCRLAVVLVEKRMGKDVSAVLSEKGISINESAFTDTSSHTVLSACALGIVNGMGNGIFLPDGNITREQAAVMLMRASNVLGYVPSARVASFADRDKFSDYAVSGIDFVAAAGVMNGQANNMFAPAGYYTREMAYLTMLRLYNAIGKSSGANVSGSGAASSTLTAEEIFKKCSPAVFPVTVYNYSGEVLATGSGFFIASDGTFVTNYHVIENAYSATVKLSDGRAIKAQSILGYSKEKDLAVIKADVSGVSYLAMGNSDDISSGQKVYAIGSPLGLENSISDGIVSNPYREEVGGIQITAAISSGSSGGALISEKGEVIGVTFAGIEEGQNLNFAIPINEVKKLDKSKVLTFAQMNAEMAKLEYEQRPGLYEANYSESEPNNSPTASNGIANGYTVSGSVYSGNPDVFHAFCATSGTIRVRLGAKSNMAKYISLAAAPLGAEKEEDIVMAEGGYVNSSYNLTLEYKVHQAGHYNIYIVAGISGYNIPYDFYYEFIPD